MIGDILPGAVSWAEIFGDAPPPAPFPQEAALLGRAAGKRRREFAAGRACAHRALAALGLPPAPLLRGPGGAPGWPPGIAGSITHCPGYAAAAAARHSDALALGVDAEPDEPLPAGVLAMVARPAEQAMLLALAAAGPGPSWDRLLFSAKESVYKAWFPLAGRWLGFADADITLDPGAGTFTARLLVPGPLAGGRQLDTFAGRWTARDGLLLTSVIVA